MYRLGLLIAILSVAACGSTTGPDGDETTTSSVTVTVTTPLRMGQTAQATGTARLSNGQTQAVTTGWRSDVQSVATVTDAGAVTAVANGLANIYVISGDTQGQQLIRVVPDYHGTWTGGLRVTACTQSGAWASAKACGDFPVNFVSGYTLSLEQSGESMNARVSYGGPSDFPTVTVPIRADGKASFVAALSVTDSGFTATVDATFAIDSVRVGELTGTVNEVWRAPNISGEMRLAQDIVSTTRTSTTPSGAERAGAPIKFQFLQRLPR